MKSKTHLMTFVVEDYFHSSALSSLISPRRWQRFETRIEANTRSVMNLLDEHDTKATFFVLGWVADEMPHLVGEIHSRGHEVASKGYSRQSLEELTPDEFRADVRRAKEAIERAASTDVLGFRLGRGSLQCCDLWVLDVLAEEGYRYDSSIYPQFRSAAKDPWRRFPHVHHHDDLKILELPLSTFGRDEWLLRVAGGNYARQFPTVWIKQAFRFWHEHYISPFNMYFHVWEFDANAPRITGASWVSRVRQYRNLSKVPGLLQYFLENYSFGPIAEVMEMSTSTGTPPSARSSRDASCVDSPIRTEPHATLPKARSLVSQGSLVSHGNIDRPNREQITVVIPCFNEQPVLRYLDNTLAELDNTLGRSYQLNFLFVDDGSTDGTHDALQELFGDRPNHRVVAHEKNQGVAAATLTGIRLAETEVVCTMDADCSYDPHQLQALLSMLTDSVDLVTASPYHPLGGVTNVPRWRLFLSRGASRLYRLLLRNKLHTYTSCFRAYRKSAAEDIQIRNGQFLGITEILWQLDRRGSLILECPAILEVRVLGTSKLKTLRGIASHLQLLSRIALAPGKLNAKKDTDSQPPAAEAQHHEANYAKSNDRSTTHRVTV